MNDQVHLADCIARKLLEGASYNRETFESCYFETAQAGATERREVSELWINYLWNKLEKVSASQLTDAHKDHDTFVKLVYVVWGK